MELGAEETQKQRSTYYKNLCKQQKKQRKERKREEELKRQHQARKTRFEKLVKKICEKGEKVQDPESEDLKSMDQGILVSNEKQCLITILLVSSKVFEKLVHSRLASHLEDIYHNNVFAYRDHHGCDTAILSLTEQFKKKLG